MSGPEQHAATVERLAQRLRTHIDTDGLVVPPDDARAALDELVALAGRADELQGRLYAIENMPPDGYLAINVVAMRPSDELEQARREADQLRAALRFYADPSTYVEGNEPHPTKFATYITPIREDNGEVARAALAGVQAEEPPIDAETWGLMQADSKDSA